MTGYLAGATSTPLSRITVGSLFDLGYTVDMRAADAFTIANLGSCGSFCPAARRRHLRVPEHLISSEKDSRRRKLSDKGMVAVKEYAKDKFEKMRLAQPMDLPDGVDYVGDKLIEVFYEEDGIIHDVRLTSDDV